MSTLDSCTEPARTRVGLAYSAAVHHAVVRENLEVDYVEVPFELLQHDPGVFAIEESVPIVMHCATLSIAGTARCPEETLNDIANWVERTKTPWLGEHLAFVTASRSDAGGNEDAYAPGAPYNIGYTVSPVMNPTTIERVERALAIYRQRIDVPILLENSPVYFRAPGSTMSQPEFISEICDRSGAGLLLDLSHFAITCTLSGADPMSEIECLPLHVVTEIHLSGIKKENGAWWDDHTEPAPEIAHLLLQQVLRRTVPKAITLEYNWSPRFPVSLMAREVARVRDSCAGCHAQR